MGFTCGALSSACKMVSGEDSNGEQVATSDAFNSQGRASGLDGSVWPKKARFTLGP